MMCPEKDTAPPPKETAEVSLPVSALIGLLRDTLAKGVPLRFQARGFSMSPFIREGDVITVSPLAERSPKLGDVVASVPEARENLVLHRVVGLNDNVYTLMGDNAVGSDGPVRRSEILGWVTRVERNGKRVILSVGPERYLIALLDRQGWTLPLIRCAMRIRRLFRREA